MPRSQNKNVNAHSVIENASKSKFIYTTTQWETTITQAFKKNTCEVKVLIHDDFINFKSINKFPELFVSPSRQMLSLERKRKLCEHQ